MAPSTMGGMGGAQVVDLHGMLTAWGTGPFALVAAAVLVAAAAWYLRAVGQVRAKGRSWGTARVAAFLAGLAAVELALGSPVATYTMTHFPAHVLQHLLLMVIAPPLLAMGAPSTLLLSTAPRPVRRGWQAVLHSAPFAALTHPVVVWFLYYGAMFAFFLSPALGQAMEHMALMDVWNVGFLLGACCFWWPMVGLDPIPRWRMGYGMRFVNLLIGVPFESFLGYALLTTATPVAPMYSLASSHAGGGILWAATEVLTVAAMLPLFVQWSQADTREGRRADARLATAAPAGPDPVRLRGLAATFAAVRRDP